MFAIAAGLRLLPEVKEKSKPLPEALSAVSLVAGVLLLVLGTVQGPRRGWSDARTTALFAGALLSFAVTVQRTLRAPNPSSNVRCSRCGHSRRRSPARSSTHRLRGFPVRKLDLHGDRLALLGTANWPGDRAGSAARGRPFVSAGRIQHHFGQLAPALLGVLTMGLAGLLWRLDAGPSRHYVTEMLPSLLLSGASGGLTVAPLFAQTSTLASERATTGSALLNVSRQLGSAIGIAVVVAATGSGVGLSGFRFAWTAQFIVEIVTAMLLAWLLPARRRRLSNVRRREAPESTIRIQES